MPEFGQMGQLEASILYAIYLAIALLVIIRDPGSNPHKILWALLIIFFPCLGFIAYLFLGRKTYRIGR